MGVRVVVRVVANDDAGRLQMLDDRRVGLEHVLADPVGDFSGVATVAVHRTHHRDARCLTRDLVVFAEARRHVHDTGSIFGGHEVGAKNLERVLGVGEVREQRLIAATDQIGAAQRGHHLVADLALVSRQPGRGHDQTPTLVRNHRILDIGCDGQREVGGQRPRRGGPGEDLVATVEAERDSERRILPIAIHVVHARLGVAERCLAPPAIGQHAVALVDQTLVPQRLEGPHDTLHVREVERLVVVVEVDPPSLASDVALPLARVAQHTRTAELVELLDAVFGDFGMTRDAELLLGLDFGRQSVAVPAEAPLDSAPAHGLVARHRIFHEPSEQVTVVRKTVGERWTVVEDELVVAVRPRGTSRHRRLEGLLRLPTSEHRRFDRRERRLRFDRRVLMARHERAQATSACPQSTWRMTFKTRITTSGERSSPPNDGNTRRTGPSTGSVTRWTISLTGRGPPPGNHDRTTRTINAIWNTKMMVAMNPDMGVPQYASGFDRAAGFKRYTPLATFSILPWSP